MMRDNYNIHVLISVLISYVRNNGTKFSESFGETNSNFRLHIKRAKQIVEINTLLLFCTGSV